MESGGFAQKKARYAGHVADGSASVRGISEVYSRLTRIAIVVMQGSSYGGRRWSGPTTSEFSPSTEFFFRPPDKKFMFLNKIPQR